MKRKLVTFGIAFLLCIGMVGAGFASWLITADVTNEVAGNIEVQTVTDKRLKMTTTLSADTQSVIFGGKAGSYTYDWLKHDGNEEQLDITFTVKVDNYDALKNETVTFVVELTAPDLGNYAVKPTTDNVLEWDDFVASESAEDTSATATVTLSYTWGSTFGGKNPLEFYNSQEYSVDLGNAAYAAINALSAINTEAGFVVTITGSVA